MSTIYASGAAFFTRGFDTQIVREDLMSQNESRQLSALQQVVAYMTVGKDMSSVFNEVTALTSTNRVNLKRLTYLYLMHYSRSQPEKAVLQAGTFVKHTLHDSPLVRGAALRVMTSLPISVMADFLTAPLRRCLADSHPYVRRVAATGVLKQYAISPTVSYESGLLDALPDRFADDNAAVAAAAVQSACEIVRRGGPEFLHAGVVAHEAHLVSLLPTANEWAALSLAEGIALAFEEPPPPAAFRDAAAAEDYVAARERTLQRVVPLLCHANSAVVMAACKCLLHFLRAVAPRGRGEGKERARAAEAGGSLVLRPAERERLSGRYGQMVARVLVGFVEAPRHEMRYVGLRGTLLLLVTGAPQQEALAALLRPHLSAYLIQYDDPVYVKLVKLDILVAVADGGCGARVLGELMVHATDADAEVVRHSIRAVGALAAKLPACAPQCVRQLEVLLNTRVPSIVEETAVVVQRLLRRYRDQFLDVIPTLCGARTVVATPEAMAAVAWVVGEHGARMSPDALAEYRDFYTEEFPRLPLPVQLAALTAVAKMYVRGAPERAEGDNLAALERVLTLCMDSTRPDLRDRATFYWRLAVADPAAARRVLSADAGAEPSRPQQQPQQRGQQLERALGHSAVRELGTLVGTLHAPLSHILAEDDDADAMMRGDSSSSSSSDADADADGDADSQDGGGGSFPTHDPLSGKGDDDDGEEEEGGYGAAAARAAAAVANNINNSSTTAAGASPMASAAASSEEFTRVLDAAAGSGVQISMRWSQLGTKLVLTCRFELLRGDDYVRHARVATLQINANMFALGIRQVFPALSLDPADRPAEVALVVACNNRVRPTPRLECAVEMSPVGVRYLVAPPIPPPLALLPSVAAPDPRAFSERLRAMPGPPAWVMPPLPAPVVCQPQRLLPNALRVHCLRLVYRKEVPAAGVTGVFIQAETIARQPLLFEMTLRGDTVVRLSVHCASAPVAAFFGQYLLRYVSGCEELCSAPGAAPPSFLGVPGPLPPAPAAPPGTTGASTHGNSDNLFVGVSAA